MIELVNLTCDIVASETLYITLTALDACLAMG